MNTAVSARSMHDAFLPNPGSGSLEIRSENLRLKLAVGFLSDALSRAEKGSSLRGVVHFSEPIRASAGVQTELIHVSSKDVSKVFCFQFLLIYFRECTCVFGGE